MLISAIYNSSNALLLLKFDFSFMRISRICVDGVAYQSNEHVLTCFSLLPGED